jgi:hypothetical protein
MKKLARGLLVFGFVAATLVASSIQATTYNVNRSFSGATLTGTLDIPVGNYTIQNAGLSPFTAVDLTLTVNATPYNLVNALTGTILGTGQFIIDATPTTLTFDTANADGVNPADLVFSDTTLPFDHNRYAIGYNGLPGFEIAFTNTGDTSSSFVAFPEVFGTVVPEPSSLALASLGLLGMSYRRRKQA